MKALKICIHHFQGALVYGVWDGHGYGVMDCLTCKNCGHIEYAKFTPEDPKEDGPVWVNPKLKQYIKTRQ